MYRIVGQQKRHWIGLFTGCVLLLRPLLLYYNLASGALGTPVWRSFAAGATSAVHPFNVHLLLLLFPPAYLR